MQAMKRRERKMAPLWDRDSGLKVIDVFIVNNFL